MANNVMITHSWAYGLVRRVMPNGEVRVLQSLFTGDALRRVKVKHLGEQIEGQWVRVRKHLRERHPWSDGQRTDVVLCLEFQVVVAQSKSAGAETTYPGRADAAERVLGRCPEIMQDLVQLIDIAAPNKASIK